MQQLPSKAFLQCMPNNLSRQRLIALQDEYEPYFSRAHRVPEEVMHITVVHVGNPRTVFKQLQQLNPLLGYKVFAHALLDMLSGWEDHTGFSASFTAKEFGWFGNSFVLMLEQNDHLERLFMQSYDDVVRFLADCSIDSKPENIPYLRGGLQLRPAIVPHITLFKRVENRYNLTNHSALPLEELHFSIQQIFY